MTPGDVRAVERVVAIERRAARARPREAASDDHLRRRRAGRSLREARRVREAGRIEERVLVIDAVVDDGHLHAVAARARQPRERGRAEHRRPAVQVERVRVARIDAVRGLDLEEIRQPLVRARSRRSRSRAPGSDATHRCLGDLLADARDRPRLSGLEPAEVRRARTPTTTLSFAFGAEPGKPPRERRRRERRIVERDDDAHAVVRVLREARRSRVPGAPSSSACSMTSRGVRSSDPEAVPVTATAARREARSARRRTGGGA